MIGRSALSALLFAACASPPAAHTIEPAASSSASAGAHWPSAPVDRSSVVASLKSLHAVIEAWRASNHSGDCPTVQRMKDERELGASASVNDAWGTAYKVTCDEDATHVISFGPDRREGTADDIVFP